MSMMIMSSTFELIWLSSTSFVTKDVDDDDDDEFGIGTHLTFIYIFHSLQFIVTNAVYLSLNLHRGGMLALGQASRWLSLERSQHGSSRVNGV